MREIEVTAGLLTAYEAFVKINLPTRISLSQALGCSENGAKKMLERLVVAGAIKRSLAPLPIDLTIYMASRDRRGKMPFYYEPIPDVRVILQQKQNVKRPKADHQPKTVSCGITQSALKNKQALERAWGPIYRARS